MDGQRLFISHASEDAAVAEQIVGYLEARGGACWIASRDIPPRAIYADAIVEGMQSCDACVVLISAASNASKAVKREVELASHEDKPFIPIRVDGSEPASGLAYYLRNMQWIEYKRDGDRALDRIIGRSEKRTERVAPTWPAHLVGAVWTGTTDMPGLPRITWRFNADHSAHFDERASDPPKLEDVSSQFYWQVMDDKLCIMSLTEIWVGAVHGDIFEGTVQQPISRLGGPKGPFPFRLVRSRP